MAGLSVDMGRTFSAGWLLLVAALVAVPAASQESGPYAYITNQSADTVSVIDTASGKVAATVPVGKRPA